MKRGESICTSSARIPPRRSGQRGGAFNVQIPLKKQEDKEDKAILPDDERNEAKPCMQRTNSSEKKEKGENISKKII